MDQRSFGVCLIEKGHEVGGGDQRFEYGTLSTVKKVAELGSGQLMISCIGEERIRIQDWHKKELYPTASVEVVDVDDLGEINLEQLEDVCHLINRTGHNIFRLTGRKANKVTVVGLTTIEAIYHLAEHSYLGAYDRYQILATEVLTERFSVLHELIIGIDEIYSNELKMRGESE